MHSVSGTCIRCKHLVCAPGWTWACASLPRCTWRCAGTARWRGRGRRPRRGQRRLAGWSRRGGRSCAATGGWGRAPQMMTGGAACRGRRSGCCGWRTGASARRTTAGGVGSTGSGGARGCVRRPSATGCGRGLRCIRRTHAWRARSPRRWTTLRWATWTRLASGAVGVVATTGACASARRRTCGMRSCGRVGRAEWT